MALILVVRSLNPWLQRFGAYPGDFVIDRAMFRSGPPLPHDELRYLLYRPLPDAAETSGWVLDGIASDDLVQVDRLTRPASSYARPVLELLPSPPQQPDLPARRRWGQRA
jgi:hypothetical protein